MAVEVSKEVRPAVDFAIQVVVGAFMFTIVALVAVGIAGLIKLIEWLGFAPPWLIEGLHWAEWGVFWLDLFCFGLFLMSEAIKLIIGMWKELVS